MVDVYTCYSCNFSSTVFFARCKRCHTWQEGKASAEGQDKGPKPLARIKVQKVTKVPTGIPELDTALDGGFVAGMIYLLSGDPGAGKSTLALELCTAFDSALYITGEETESAVKARANRLGIKSGINVWSVKSLDPAVDYEESSPAEFRVYDSIQSFVMEDINGIPGSVGQIVACGHAISEHVHEMERSQCPVIALIISQVNAAGETAGPNALEHLVDATCHLSISREFTVIKNRHGPAPRGVQLKMGADGFRR